MMKKFVLFFTLLHILTCSACRHSTRHDEANTATDSLPEKRPVQDTLLIRFDSTAINDFLQQHPMNDNYKKDLVSFYRNRNYVFAWINSTSINEYGRNFINLLNHEERKEDDKCILYPDRLQSLYNLISDSQDSSGIEANRFSDLDFLLTLNFFAYAERNWKGINEEEVKKIGWHIERKQIKYDNLLDSILKIDPVRLSFYEPVYRQYGLLKGYLKKYYAIEKQEAEIRWPERIKALKKGDTSDAIPSIKKKLYLLEDLPIKDSSTIFDNVLELAVKGFQKRHGLKEDGIIGGSTLKAMHVSIHERITQLLINMERCRWVPAEQQGDYLVVNIPAFKLFVYHNDSLEWSCNVIVGKTKETNNTVIFNDNLEYIVFDPYWNIPRNILLKETLPEIKLDHAYLLKHDMEVVDESGRVISPTAIDWNKYTTSFPYIIRQKPGKNNSLGLIKFLFPNSYDIYMHDTPEKSLFGETTRTFSHGCIRVEESYKLARFLLREDPDWTEEKINAVLEGGTQTFVKLKNKVPVFVAYFTAWVDREGKLNFRDDIYHHDAKMKRLLFP